MADRPSAFFLPGERGERFCLYHEPAARGGPPRGVVYVHPFGEEMHKSRRMAALQSRRLAQAGCAVLQIDLYGCGDSSGEFADARWEIWRRDVRAAVDWLRGRSVASVGLWGLRLGAALAADVAGAAELEIAALLMWQPVASGEQFLTQFLRLHLAAEMLAAGAAQTGIGALRETLARGTALEIAGYELHPELASAVERLKLADLAPAVPAVYCLEVSPQPDPQPTPATRRALESWRSPGREIRVAAVTGDPFWSTLEITECAPLLAATDDAMGLTV